MTRTREISEAKIVKGNDIIKIGENVCIFVLGEFTILATYDNCCVIGSKETYDRIKKNDVKIVEADYFGDPCTYTWIDENTGMFIRTEDSKITGKKEHTLVFNAV